METLIIIFPVNVVTKSFTVEIGVASNFSVAKNYVDKQLFGVAPNNNQKFKHQISDYYFECELEYSEMYLSFGLYKRKILILDCIYESV